MTEEEKRLQEEQQRNAEMMDRAIAYARSVGYDVSGQQAPATQPEQSVTQPTTQTAAPTTLPAGQTTPTPTVTPTATTQPVQPTTTLATQPIPTAKNTDEAYRNLISATQEAGNNLTAAKVAQTQSDLDFYQQQDAERRKADAEAWQQVLNGQKDLLQYWVDRDNEAKAEAKRAEEEDRMKTEMENRRAGLAGAGEVAASLINLFSVGGLHASNQVYKDHMQDWMKKADADRKYRQLRIDQLRERQRAIGDKQAALRYANTEANYNQYLNQAKEQAQRAADMQKLRSAIPVIEAAGKAETTATAGKLEVDRNKAVTDEKLTRASIAARASGGGRTDSDLRIVTFPAFGDANNGGLPSETYQVRSKDIVINAKTHLNQLSADERAEVKAILNDPEKDMEEKADAILPFLTENKAFRQAIQIASVGHLVNGKVADNKRKKGPDALLGDDEDPTK